MIFVPVEDLAFAPLCVKTKWKDGILLDISLFLTFLLLDLKKSKQKKNQDFIKTSCFLRVSSAARYKPHQPA